MPTPPPFPLAELQRKKAEALHQRKLFLTALASGSLTLTDALDLAEHNTVVAGTRLHKVLSVLPRLTPDKATALMTTLGISEKRKLGGLLGIPRQKAALLGHFAARRTGRPWVGWPYRPRP